MSSLVAVGSEPFGYAICMFSFILCAALSRLSALEGPRFLLMTVGCLATAVWAAAAAAIGFGWWSGGWLIVVLETIRSLSWLALLAAMLGEDGWLRKHLRFLPYALLILAVVLFLAVTALWVGVLRWLHVPALWVPIYFYLVFAIAGLLMLENLFRNTDPEIRWGVKHLCLGLGVLFFYDFYFYADSALTLRFDPVLRATRGYIDSLAVPFLFLAIGRGKTWRGGLRPSRRVVFHSAVLLGAGVYLLAMSLAGTLLHSIGGGWGPVLQSVFLAAALLIMLAAFSSTSFRSSLRVFISKNFYRHKYDYREIWLSFIQRMSREEGGENLHQRTLHAVADILDCPAGALWVLQPEDDAYFPTAVWNFGDDLPVVSATEGVAHYLSVTNWIIDIPEFKRDPARYESLKLPDWLLQHSRAWMIVPLIHHHRLEAVLVLGHPRTPTTAGWEEIDLLKTLGAQAASYLAEESSSRALMDARRLEEFNQRFAFVIHDIKNIVSQMSLMIENAKQHGDNPEFQKDMLATVSNSVTRMRTMLAQLAANRRKETSGVAAIDLTSLVERVFRHWQGNYPALRVMGLEQTVVALAIDENLVSVLDHLIQNAIEAVQGKSAEENKDPDLLAIDLVLRQEQKAGVALESGDGGGEAIIEVRDRGVGMDAEFIRTQLFRPLDTWQKTHGMGLGVFQARQLARGMGGRLEVESVLGVGTTMRIRLRLASDTATKT